MTVAELMYRIQRAVYEGKISESDDVYINSLDGEIVEIMPCRDFLPEELCTDRCTTFDYLLIRGDWNKAADSANYHSHISKEDKKHRRVVHVSRKDV